MMNEVRFLHGAISIKHAYKKLGKCVSFMPIFIPIFQFDYLKLFSTTKIDKYVLQYAV